MTPTLPPRAIEHLVAIDWGTTSLRAALLGAGGATLARLEAPRGILFTDGRSFPDIFAELFGPWLGAYPGAAVLASGMIGSRQGWVEAPYAPCPAGFGDLAGSIVWHEAPGAVPIGIVPGISAERDGVPDVMRGEEVQVFGVLATLAEPDVTVVLPGTHSKWVDVRAGRVAHFRTFMTGEVYGLLRTRSILSKLMEAPDAATPLREAAFDRGLATARATGRGEILHSLFRVRTLGLFGRMGAEDQPDFLSGLLIGEEVREALNLLGERPSEVRLVCRGDLAERYRRAFLGEGVGVVAVDPEVTFRGLFALARAAGLFAGDATP